MEETQVHKNPGMQFIAAVAVITVLVGGGYFLIRRGSTTVQQGTSPEDAGAQEIIKMNQETQEIMVTGNEFSFSPSTITVQSGQPVRLVFTNIGKMPHDFIVDEMNVRTKIIKSGETDAVTFTPTQAGTFSFYCSVGNHRTQGMEGTITVQQN